MFLCDKCHNEANHLIPFQSFGRCEDCGRTATCIDCKRVGCKPPVRKITAKGPSTRKE